MLKEFLEAFHNFTHYGIDDFEIIETPNEFYKKILEKINSSNTVHLACLVLGAGEKSRRLIDALSTRMRENRKTVLMIDRSRNMGNASLVAYIDKVKLWPIIELVDMSKCRFLPYMFNELLGVYHLKAYVFDDEVCISGANLDESYFVDRIDRYYFFKSAVLADSLITGIFDSIKGHGHMNRQRMKPSNEKQAETKSLISLEAITEGTITRLFSFTKDEELSVLEKLFSFKYDDIVISTAYLNFSNHHLSILKKQNFSLVVPSIRANTFNNASLLGSLITEVYGYSSYKTKGYLPHIDLCEYNRPEYSFHSKGIWLLGEDIAVTVIGSSNFNRRSIGVDEECTWVIASNNPTIRSKLCKEMRSLQKYSKPLTMEELCKRHVRWIIVVIFYLLNIFI
ncbi:CDP-diacylglycerol---glycerol-3-phosphate 3-phosphatidyltransferase [Pancytospora epiphaga]|nr:CDP-diacylglycerol---glycerol-3-phosphate 3-phosphatidyltransferase [Pancytospora epiphaga]